MSRRTDINSKFAPTPMHGAAYAIAIKVVGGIDAIGSCASRSRYDELRAKLDALLAFARSTNDPKVFDAYDYGVAKVDADLKGRIEILENSRMVAGALANLPKPEGL